MPDLSGRKGLTMDRSGFIFAAGAALLWGFTPLIEKTGLAKATPLAGLTIRTMAVAVALVFTLLFSGQFRQIGAMESKGVIFMVVGGLIAGGIGQWLYYQALKSTEASRVVPIAGSYPLLAMIASIVFLGKQITLSKVIGTLLIVGGIILIR